MSEEQQIYPKEALNKFRQWHFWWLVVFSFLLVITFIYYLPIRFLQQTGMKLPHGHEEDENMQEHMKQGMTEEEMMKHMGEEYEGSEHAREGHEAVYFEENTVKQGLVVNLNINPVPYNVGVPLSMDFFVNQKPRNIPILANQLQVEHEKLMHVIGVRSDMNEFFHLHPEFLVDNQSVFNVGHTFNKPGFYKIWSEIKKNEVNYSFGHPDINVNGPGLKEDKKISFSHNVIAGNYQISFETSDTVVKGREVNFTFDIHSLTGMEVEVEQYLGADMHLSIIKDDRSRFIHTHPEEENGDHSHSRAPWLINFVLAHGGVEDEPAGATNEHQTSSSGDEVITFHVIFPEAGLYKAFAQFRPKDIDLPTDQALLAEFWFQVEEKAPFPVSQWWGLLVISALLIASLSWLVNNYLKVKPEDVKLKS